jgi:hypothetical protein
MFPNFSGCIWYQVLPSKKNKKTQVVPGVNTGSSGRSKINKFAYYCHIFGNNWSLELVFTVQERIRKI